MQNSLYPNVRIKPPGPKAKSILAKEKKYISPSYTKAYPLAVDHASGMYVWDADGNKYLDFTAGVAVNTLGHCHPEIIKVIHEQSQKLMHMAGTDFYYKPQADLAEKLSDIMPGNSRKISFFTNSGTEAVEAAIKLARYATRRPRILAFIGSFHGRTMGSLSLTSSKAVQRRHFSPLLPEVTHVPYAYCYRCVYNLTYPKCKMACVDFIDKWIFKKVAPPEDVAAIVVEPIQGEGGYIMPPPQFFPTLKNLCDKYGILLIVDEIQSGMGRTGKMWAIEHWGVVPDIICIAKGIASGLPIGAMTARVDLHVWKAGAHANTFGGNPIACVSALKTIEMLEKGLIENARKMGEYLYKKLNTLLRKYGCIGDHRGVGLMQGLEIVKNKKSKEQAPELRNKIENYCFEKGLLVLGCGDSAIRFIPSLIVEREHIDIAIEIFEKAIKECTKN